MPSNRRSFIKEAGLFSFSTLLGSLAAPAWARRLEKKLTAHAHLGAEELAGEEDFWYAVQQAFTSSTVIINLNNGGVSPAPITVQEAMKRYYDFSNEAPSYFMWRILDQGRESVRTGLARLGGCSPEEVAINRNASEGLETVIFGLPLKAGDEVVASKQDYPHVVNAWKQRELRDGIRVRWVNLELPSEDEDYLVRQFTAAFTPRTRVVTITHMINWNGQILPVRKIADEARRRGIEVLVDGAHTYGQLQFSIPDLNADYYASSLHKWLYAPIGSGMLYVRKEKIAGLFPLFAADDPKKADIRKFEDLGTRPFFIEQAIGKAIEFHDMIGAERKEKRLHYLKNYWMERLATVPGVQLHTSPDPRWGCAVGLISVANKKPAELDGYLFKNYRIHTSTIDLDKIRGVRITPNVYTTTRQLDVLVEGVTRFVKG
jgi:selenocysteine lyase/cysteine desulfurase